MGYWDIHPMAGDDPLDYRAEIDMVLFTEDEWYEKEGVAQPSQEELQKRFEDDIEELIKNFSKYGDHSFVLPFTIISFGLFVEDSTYSQAIKEMIRDGGAGFRGYDVLESNKENGYNNFESPNDYAAQLYDNWDKIMSKEISSDVLKEHVGLIDTIVNHVESGNIGLVNVN